ncbi:MAG: hypothetical protein JNM94_00690 [Phycisphaerae bacterium]|nr:hypothetical protein [Phycisphaerae bacterium]
MVARADSALRPGFEAAGFALTRGADFGDAFSGDDERPADFAAVPSERAVRAVMPARVSSLTSPFA